MRTTRHLIQMEQKRLKAVAEQEEKERAAKEKEILSFKVVADHIDTWTHTQSSFREHITDALVVELNVHVRSMHAHDSIATVHIACLRRMMTATATSTTMMTMLVCRVGCVYRGKWLGSRRRPILRHFLSQTRPMPRMKMLLQVHVTLGMGL